MKVEKSFDLSLFNNVGELEKTVFGYKLHRFPMEVEQHMNEGARWMSQYCCGCELRFVTEAQNVDVTLLAEGAGGANVIIFKGDYVWGKRILETGRITTIRLTNPSVCAEEVEDEFYRNNRFSKNVWRIWMHNGHFTLCDINGYGSVIRPPKQNEMPQKTLLAYGSSITHGAGADFHYSCYINQLAVKLGWDVIGKGLGGSCQCEREAVDYLVDECWDCALLEPAINMVGCFEEKEYEERVKYLVEQIAGTGKPVFVTTIYPNRRFYLGVNDAEYQKMQRFDEITRNVCKHYDNVRIVEGRDILTDTEYLSADGIHPCDYGHFMMAQKWYNLIKEDILKETNEGKRV